MAVPDVIRARYLEVNGDHPTTAADEVYCRQHFVPLAGDGTYPLDDVHRMIVDRRLALPSYLLGDGTPMVHPGHLDLLHAAGGPELVERWFCGHWPAEEQPVAAEEWDAYLSGQYVCLHRVTPETIQAKTRLIDRIRELVALVDAGPRDADIVDELRQRVDELDALEPPFAPDYDALRFGGPSSRAVWIDDVRATYLVSAAS